MYLTRTNQRESAGAFPALTDRIQRALNESLGGLDWMYRDSAAASWVPAVDVVEEPDAIRITAEIPGVKPEDIRISLEGNVLTIQGMKEEEREENTERVHRYERMYGVFERSFTLPSSVEPKEINANYDNGVLTITLPKSEKAKPRQIEVKTGNGSKSKRSVEVEQQGSEQRSERQRSEQQRSERQEQTQQQR
jgi:HSP20 family protein